ncbi:hypothetical protein MTO96_048945 [Rhipicephalus appendiculatus]
MAAADQPERLNIDNVIERLIAVRGCHPGKNVDLAEHEIRGLCLKTREIFLAQPILLELEAPPEDLRRYPRPVLRPAAAV